MSRSVTDKEAETAFMPSNPQRDRGRHSSNLCIQQEGVSSSNKTNRDKEGAPLLSSGSKNYSSPSRYTCAKLGAISLLIFACVLAGSMTFTGIILLAVSPETLQRGEVKILPNDTVLAVPDSGLDSNTVNYIMYTYNYYLNYDKEQSSYETATSLFFYRERCSSLTYLTKARPLSISYSFTLSQRDLSLVEVDNRYLVKGSTIEYLVNLTLSPSEMVPSYCYAKLHLRDVESSEVVEICNDTMATFQLSATENAYTPLYLSVTSSNIPLQAVNVHASGTVRYYDNTQSHDQFDCQINPPFRTSCLIVIHNQIDDGNNDNICILAFLESSSSLNETSSFSSVDYKIATFSYKQIVPLVLVCVGLVAFVTMLGFLFSCFTRQGKRLRAVLKMTSPLQN